ncbi:hypothetical protein [Amycolatopsis sp. NPDC052450]|uniref:hypothetical protein n=1 Tax=Amycolatopsis sp. NPDC052450 TaxID=3363937 RepID=UPI0037CBF4DA
MLHGRHIAESARAALSTVDPIPFYAKYGDDTWAAVTAHLDTATEYAAPYQGEEAR